MADQQRIHPVHDPEVAQKPSSPMVPRGASRSEQGDPEKPSSPLMTKGAPQSEQGNQGDYYRPLSRTIPLTYEKPPKRRSCCYKCFCWSISFLLILLTIFGILAAIIYFVFQPKIPKYSVDSLRITQFDLNTDNSLYATFNVNITARNSNKKIGIYYEGGSHISVWYTGTKLCEGVWPKFYQGHRNTTVLDLTLTGQSTNASDLLGSLQAQQQTGSVPLNLRVKVPVRIKLGRLKLMKWRFLVKCRLVVDTLAADNVIRIRDRSCKFRFRF